MKKFQSKNACINTIFSEIVNLFTGKVFIWANGQLFNNIFIFLWCKRALYSINSSLWLLRSRKLTGWLKSPDICRGWRGMCGPPVKKKLRHSAVWFIFGDFSNIVIPNVDIHITYIRAAYYVLNPQKENWNSSAKKRQSFVLFCYFLVTF